MDNPTREGRKPEMIELLPPSSDVENVGKEVFKMLSQIIVHKDALGKHDQWLFYEKLKKGKHWKRLDKPGLKVINLLWTHLKKTENMLTQNFPTFNVIRTGEIAEGKAEMLDSALQMTAHWWNETEQHGIFRSSVGNGETYGATFHKMEYDKEIDDVVNILIDPYFFGVYPVTALSVDEADAVFYFRPVPCRMIEQTWPEVRGKVVPDTELIKTLGDERREIGSGRSSGTSFAKVSNVVYKIFGGDTGSQEPEGERSLLIECWVKDRSVLQQKVETIKIAEDGTEVVTEAIVNKRAYPGCIRRVQVCNCGDLVLDDMPNPSINPQLPEELAKMTYYWDRFPFPMANSERDTTSIWGGCDFDQLYPMQQGLDMQVTALDAYVERAVRLKIKNPQDSGVPNEALTNFLSIINPVTAQQGKGIEYMNSPQLQLDVKIMADIYQNLFHLVAGTFDVDLAKEAGRGQLAHKTVQDLIQHSAIMKQGKVYNYSQLVREIGRGYMSLAQNFFTTEHVFPFTDKQTEQEGYKSIRGTDLILPFKLTVVTGSTLPISEVAQQEQAVSLFEKGAISVSELHRRLKTSDWRRVIRELEQGPLSRLIDMLAQMGAPPPLLQFLTALQKTDSREFDRLFKNGEIPPFDQMIAQWMGGGQPEDETAVLATKADALEKIAKAQNMLANAELTDEKIATERLKQFQMATGIKYDEKALEIEVAKIRADIQKNRQDFIASQTTKFATKTGAQGPYRERGLKSNNLEG